MAVLQKQTEQEVFTKIQGAAPLLLAFIECSNELQQHAKEMLVVLLDPEVNEDDRFLAASTLADILFPNTHEGDKMLGMDLEAAEEMAKQSPEAAAALAEMDRDEETFAVRLRQSMEEKGVTQEALAKKTGVGQPAISMMLNRACRPQRKTVEKIAAALGVEPGQLWPPAAKSV
jgi:lambda repressor-like predicted transcriptional regulator